ncbi:sensor histidine kinase [Dongia sedimenti]|uniref:histidine kinase n=1 Tax=Dongia sedimenti TaxID=3064282 RepID=A0ABU0YRS5_9PROT|nr:ATP-binding protein [Rhodospirillaceae bacterium R-7]
MLRLGLSFRILLIGLTAGLSIWTTMIAFYYWNNGAERTASLPSAAQLLAITRVVNNASSDQRVLALQAVGSSLIKARISDESRVAVADARELVGDKRFSEYRQSLGGALISVRQIGESYGDMWRPRLFAGAAGPLEFRIRLTDSKLLIVDTGAPFSTTVWGLPMGMAPALIGTFFAFIAVMMLHNDIRPLTRLAAAVDQVDLTGRLLQLPRIRASAPETKALLRAFEQMQSRLHSMFRTRLALVGGIQHDIRTYATRLRLRLHAVQEERERERMESDIAEMIQLLDDALLAARGGADALNEELLDLREIVEQAIHEARYENARISLSPGLPQQSISVIGDRLALRRVLFNVIDNALKYGGKAHLSLAAAAAAVELLVDDDGPGIPPEKREIVFEPFARLEPSRARTTGGAGLGLAIVRNLIESHGGTVGIANAPDGGARIIIRLPLFKPA